VSLPVPAVPDLAPLHLRVEGGVATVEIDHGKANEMGAAAVAAWERLAAWLETGAVRVLVTRSLKRTSKGTPIFISGANVTERRDWTEAQVQQHVRWQRAVLARLRHAPVFHVTVVEGLALGWGTEFLLTADWRIATPTARMGLPETGLGILPGAGGASELPSRIGLTQALRLGMTGELVEAVEAIRIGLVDELADTAEVAMARVARLSAMVLRRSPTAVAAYKAAALAGLGREEHARRDLEAHAYEHCVRAGEAAIGRANFEAIVAGAADVPWGAYRPWKP
jgi:enoyl-CoA hydratase/carnithine racemase